MSQAATSHSSFKTILKGLTQVKAVEITNVMMTEFKKAISTKKTPVLETNFIKEIMKQGEQNFFIVPTFIPNEPSVGLMSKNLNAVMHVALNRTDKKFLKHYDSPQILDLLHLHSYRKGEGKKLMEAFLHIQGNLHIPGSLWTETIETMNYFEKYGFENLGELGDSSEFLMKLPC